MDLEKKKSLLGLLEGTVSPELIDNLRKIDLKLDSNTVKIPAPNQFIREFLERSLTDPIRAASAKVLGFEPQVLFYIDESSRVEPTVQASPVPPARPILSQVMVSEKFTFESLVTGPANEFAVAAAKSVALTPGKEYNPLLIYGKTGVGKTHLLQAIYNFVTKKNPYFRVVYSTADSFLSSFVDAIQMNKMKAFKERYREADLFLLDDFQMLQEKEGTQDEFLNIFNHLYSYNRQMVVATSVHPDHMFETSDALKSRLLSGLVVRVEPPTYEIRLAIIKRKLEVTGRSLPDDVVELLASRFASSVRQLESALIKVFGYSVVLKRPIDLELAKEALNDMLENAESVMVHDISVILKSVAKRYKMDPKVIMKNPGRIGILQKHICIYIAHKTFGVPVRRIMQFFNLGSTSTVVHATRKIERLYRNTKLKNDISLLIQEMKATL